MARLCPFAWPLAVLVWCSTVHEPYCFEELHDLRSVRGLVAGFMHDSFVDLQKGRHLGILTAEDIFNVNFDED